MPNYREVPPNLQEIATKELNEIPDELTDEIETTRDLITSHPAIGKCQLTDQFILSFLRSCKYNRRVVQKKLPNYLDMRKICPDIFASRIVNEELIEILRTGVHLPLAEPLESNSSLVYISNYGNLNLKQYSMYEGIKLFYMMLEIRFLEDDHSSVAGYTVIQDFSDLSFSHMVTMNIGVLRKILGYVRSGMPYRLKGIHIINAPWFVNGIMGLFRDSLPLKMKKRFFIHKKVNELYDHVPQRMLPEEYGGQAGSVEDIVKAWEKKLQQYSEYFESDMKFGIEPTTVVEFAETEVESAVVESAATEVDSAAVECAATATARAIENGHA